MTRKKEPEIEISPECEEAYDRLVVQAEGLAAMLFGEPVSPDTGLACNAHSQALAMGMICFMLRADPNDIEAALFAERSLGQFARKPFEPPPAGQEGPLAKYLGGWRAEHPDGEALLSLLAGA
jgi:hypothetical protein